MQSSFGSWWVLGSTAAYVSTYYWGDLPRLRKAIVALGLIGFVSWLFWQRERLVDELATNFGSWWVSACVFAYVFSYYWGDMPRLRKAIVALGIIGFVSWQFWNREEWIAIFNAIRDRW